MSDSEKPKSWRERKKTIKHKWHVLFIFQGWILEHIEYCLEHWASFQILTKFLKFGIQYMAIFSLLYATMNYSTEYHDRQKA